jgi:hypothetical protein
MMEILHAGNFTTQLYFLRAFPRSCKVPGGYFETMSELSLPSSSAGSICWRTGRRTSCLEGGLQPLCSCLEV